MAVLSDFMIFNYILILTINKKDMIVTIYLFHFHIKASILIWYASYIYIP